MPCCARTTGPAIECDLGALWLVHCYYLYSNMVIFHEGYGLILHMKLFKYPKSGCYEAWGSSPNLSAERLISRG